MNTSHAKILPLTLGLVLLSLRCAAAERSTQNVFLITIDTLRPDHLGCYGYASIQTPSIDQLARAGVRFTQAYTPVPITLPAHRALMTGEFPLATGMHDFSGNKLSSNAVTIAKILRDYGYPNANLHLAQMKVAAKQGDAVLRYLGPLPASSQSEPGVELLRAQALDLAGQRAQAEALVQTVEKQAGSDPHIWFSAGMILVGWQRYDEAEKAFTHALDAAPSNPDILYNLGLAATRAGHLDRALDIFQIALRQHPSDVDCLYNLARVYSDRGQDDQAVVLLVKAQQLAPSRADIVLFVARASEKLGYYTDTAAAYDQYLKLRPDDDIARRERGFALARGAQFEQGLVDLRCTPGGIRRMRAAFTSLASSRPLKNGPRRSNTLTRRLPSILSSPRRATPAPSCFIRTGR